MIALFAEAPALPLHTAGPYVAAAYIVFVLILLAYLGIMAMRLVRSQRELAELRRMVQERELADPDHTAPDHAVADTAPSFFTEDENDSDSHSHFALERGARSGGARSGGARSGGARSGGLDVPDAEESDAP
jgi:HAMP domain-containing protein